jgi:hypothetical protein
MAGVILQDLVLGTGQRGFDARLSSADMTNPGRHQLAVDLGTSTTIAMMRWPDGRVRPLLFDGTPLLSSAVLLGVDGQLHTGRDAAHLARGNPERLEPNPKRRIDDDLVLLGHAEVPVRDLLSAVLGRVSEEAHRVAGHLGDLTLTHPATWGSRRCAQLVEAAEHAGLGRGRLVPEPVAAATYFAHTMIDQFAPGSRVAVYDLGAGTCDITMLRRGPHGFDIVASDGLNDVGGLDVDAAIVAFLEATYGRLWTDTVSRRHVWEDVRNAKEMLSRTSGTVIPLPALGKEAPLGREQFDGLIAPVLRPTIALVKSLIRDTAAAAASNAPTAVVLVGGASRIPLVATLLADATGIAPIVIEQPELVVAEGALHLAPVADPVADVAVPSGPAAAADEAPHDEAPPDEAPHDDASPDDPSPDGFDTVEPVSGDPPVPVSGVSGPAGPVSGGPWAASGEVTSDPRGPAASDEVPAENGLAPGGLAPSRSGRSRALVAAVVVAVFLLAGASVAGIMLFNGDDDGKRGVTGQPTASASQSGAGVSTVASSRTPAPGKYAAAALPEKLCAKVSLRRLSGIYTSYANTPEDTRSGDASARNATCTMFLSNPANDTLDLSLTAVLYTDTAEAAAAQQMVFNSAKGTDPNLITLTGTGEEAFAARTRSTSVTEGSYTYVAEARDGNLRLSVIGTVVKANRQAPGDAQIRQFGRDVGEVATSLLAKLGGA